MEAPDALTDIPDTATRPGAAFFRQHKSDLMNAAAEMMAVEALERMATRFGTVLAKGTGKVPQELLPSVFHEVEQFREAANERLESRFRMLTVLAVDNYLNYVSDLIGLIYRTRPETLISQEQVSVSDVLKHESLVEFVEWLAEERVNRLSFKGFAEIEEFVNRRLGIEMVGKQTARDDLVRSVAARNILVHRRGILDRRYIETLRQAGVDVSAMSVGSQLTPPGHVVAMESVISSVMHIEPQSVAKFGLATETVGVSATEDVNRNWTPDLSV